MKYTVSYTLMDPTKNYTLLVDSPVLISDRQRVAKELMQIEPLAEQVGFISNQSGCDISLCMAGGEFCGNAAMSAAALYAEQNGIENGSIQLLVSGSSEMINAELCRKPDGSYQCTVGMPKPHKVDCILYEGIQLNAVFFDGIVHIIIDDDRLDRSQAEMIAPKLCREIRADALGLMFYDPVGKNLCPFVYVPTADTMFWENSCASGSTAVGVYIARQGDRRVNLQICQPGGTLSVLAEKDKTPLLTGHVRRAGDKKTLTLDSF